jgi:hypothetical protein
MAQMLIFAPTCVEGNCRLGVRGCRQAQFLSTVGATPLPHPPRPLDPECYLPAGTD